MDECVYVEQNPAWSEEDETILKAVILNLEELKKHCAIPSTQYVSKCINWLKSLRERYTWKQSDEQMNAFDAVLVYNPPCSNECRNHLITLYNELKKLIE